MGGYFVFKLIINIYSLYIDDYCFKYYGFEEINLLKFDNIIRI